MKLLKKVPEAAMVAAFLKAEFSSARFSHDVKHAVTTFGANENIIADPNLESQTENELRSQILGEYRGYGRNREIFEGIPSDLTWYEAELTKGEIGGLHYIDYSYWNELTSNTHRVEDAVTTIKEGKTVFNVSNDEVLAFAEDIRGGEYNVGPMILWGEAKDSVFEILEGHSRATALGLAGNKAPETIQVIVGLRQPAIL
jgi:hypothetical protein